jgi:2-methylcitrate dehydratase PrpD
MTTKVPTKKDASVALIESVIRVNYDDLSPEDIEMTKKSILDTLGTIIAGSSRPPFRQLAAYLKEQGGKAESTMLVYGDKLPVASAVLANAGMARALDFDDCHEPTTAHSSAAMVPAGFAIAEQQGGRTGKELITAVALGADTMLRILSACTTIPTRHGRSSSHVGGTFGTAMTAGKLLELDKDKMLDSFGNAYCQLTGDVACYREGALSYWIHQGIAARAGVFATILANIGVTGSKDVLEGDYGYYAIFEQGEYDSKVLTADLGKTFLGTSVSLKPFPCCKLGQAPMFAVLELVKEHDIKPEEVEEITVHCTEEVLSNTRRPIVIDPKSIDILRFNTRWCVGAIVAQGRAAIEDFTPEGVQKIKETVLPIAHKVKGVYDPKLELDKVEDSMPSVVEIRVNGKTFTKRVDYVKGHPRNPMDWEDVAAKFRECVPFAAKHLSRGNIDKVIEMVRNLDEVDDVTRICNLLS